MSVTTIARIQHRRGLRTDLPTNLEEGELGWCMDTKELFLGNSQAEGGNTQVLTANVSLMNQIRYQFLSATQVPSVTGVSANQPTVRSLQAQVDDYWVNVRAYGAQGDGITDDTHAIQQALNDLYTKTLTSNENVSQSKKAIWFPVGVYVISNSLKLWPGVRLMGENLTHTQIVLSASAVVNEMIQLTDSLGQTNSNLGVNGAQLPTHIQVENLHFKSLATTDMIRLQRCAHIRFHNCKIEGNWQLGSGSAVVTKGITVETLGSAVFTGNCEFTHTEICNVVWAYYCEDAVQNVQFSHCMFRNLFKGIVTDDDGVNPGPSYTRVSQSTFDLIDDHGIQVMQSEPGVQSMHNLFLTVGNTSAVPVIYWETGTQLCTSMNDVFARTTTPPDRILNGAPAANMVVNAQDPINMPV
jgi:hypothetical protein